MTTMLQIASSAVAPIVTPRSGLMEYPNVSAVAVAHASRSAPRRRSTTRSKSVNASQSRTSAASAVCAMRVCWTGKTTPASSWRSRSVPVAVAPSADVGPAKNDVSLDAVTNSVGRQRS